MNTNLHPGASTGPRTIEGKQISSQNALRHGCCSTSTLILPSERLEDFKALEAGYLTAYSPKNDLEINLVHELVQADWFHKRATRVVAELEAAVFEHNADPLTWNDDQHRALTRFLRYQTTRATNLTRARKNLESYLKDRTTESQVAEKLSIAKQRLEVYLEKNKPEPSIQDLIQDLMDKKAEKERLEQP